MVALRKYSISACDAHAAIPAADVESTAKASRKVLGEGSYGKVLLATYDDNKVAIKCLKQNTGFVKLPARELHFQHLWNEMLMLKNLQHPNILSLLGSAQTQEEIYLMTEFCARGSVDRLLYRPRHYSLGFDHIMKISIHTARAMAYMHSQAVLHCDLKPANLLVTADWQVKVADFGNARFISSPGSVDLEATIEYCAPEVLTGGQFTKCADVWSFGVTMWELIMQERPYQDCGFNRYMLIMLISSGALRLPTIPDGVASPGLIHIVEACLDPCPEARPTFEELVELLEEERKSHGGLHSGSHHQQQTIDRLTATYKHEACNYEAASCASRAIPSAHATCHNSHQPAAVLFEEARNMTPPASSRMSSPFASHAARMQSCTTDNTLSSAKAVAAFSGRMGLEGFASMDSCQSASTSCDTCDYIVASPMPSLMAGSDVLSSNSSAVSMMSSQCSLQDSSRTQARTLDKFCDDGPCVHRPGNECPANLGGRPVVGTRFRKVRDDCVMTRQLPTFSTTTHCSEWHYPTGDVCIKNQGNQGSGCVGASRMGAQCTQPGRPSSDSQRSQQVCWSSCQTAGGYWPAAGSVFKDLQSKGARVWSSAGLQTHCVNTATHNDGDIYTGIMRHCTFQNDQQKGGMGGVLDTG